MTSRGIIQELEQFMAKYVVLSDPTTYTVVACWIVATYLFHQFDVFPYLCITAPLKRCGKTTLSELVGFACAKPQPITGATEAAIFRLIATNAPTLIIDEAESLKSEAATAMRSLMNVGFRRGQTIPRAARGTDLDVIQAPTYCPKVFVLIGDVNDTLKDRSIIVRMARGTPPAEYRYEEAQSEGNELRNRIQALVTEAMEPLMNVYHAREIVQPIREAVSSRDRDLWLSILTVAKVFDSDERLPALYQAAVDLSTVKQTVASKTVAEYHREGVEEAARDDEYALRLLVALSRLHGWKDVPKGERAIFNTDAIRELHALPLSPWRIFEGKGLTDKRLANMLKRFGVTPRVARIHGTLGRAYLWSQVSKAVSEYVG